MLFQFFRLTRDKLNVRTKRAIAAMLALYEAKIEKLAADIFASSDFRRYFDEAKKRKVLSEEAYANLLLRTIIAKTILTTGFVVTATLPLTIDTTSVARSFTKYQSPEEDIARLLHHIFTIQSEK